MKSQIFLNSAIQQFNDYKVLGEKTFAQLNENDFYYQPNEYINSIAQNITHLHGNMLSRWTHFLTEDGEKEWRKRDDEFALKNQCEYALLVSSGFRKGAHRFYEAVGYTDDVRGFRKYY